MVRILRVSHSGSDPNRFAGNERSLCDLATVRCPYCGHKKPRQDMLCESCLRYPH